MSYRLKLLNRNLKSYDRELFAMTSNSVDTEKTCVFRKSRFGPIFILALTDNWLAHGTPREWGLDPIMRKVSEMDSHRDSSMYDDFCKERDRKKESMMQSYRNDIKAAAYDLRKDFARATNDINTSTLEKIDNRRLKDGYC